MAARGAPGSFLLCWDAVMKAAFSLLWALLSILGAVAIAHVVNVSITTKQ